MDQENVRNDLFPKTRTAQADSGIGHHACDRKDNCGEVCRVDAKKSSNPKAPPVASLLLEAQMDAKATDDEEKGNSNAAKAEWKKPNKRSRDGEIAEPAI